jgi:uncharacterized iron-regulated membrane protein
MGPSRLNRKIHIWTTAVVAVPVLVVILSGLVLQVKKQWSWVQPPTRAGTGTAPVLDLSEILAVAREVPEAGIAGWQDVDRLDVRPGRGVVKVQPARGPEVQIDLGTGEVLQVATRRSDLIEALHDGSFFGGDVGKLGIFLPSGLALLVLWFTGLWLLWAPVLRRRDRKRTAAARRRE